MSAAKMVRWSHSHVVLLASDSLEISLHPLVFQIADSSGRQNTHFPCGLTPEEKLVFKKNDYFFSSMKMKLKISKTRKKYLRILKNNFDWFVQQFQRFGIDSGRYDSGIGRQSLVISIPVFWCER